MTPSCIPRRRMVAFLAGALPPVEEAAVVDHVDGCRACERLAAELSDDLETRQIAATSRKRAGATMAGPEMDDFCRRLHALGLMESAVRSAELPEETSPVDQDDTDAIQACQAVSADSSPILQAAGVSSSDSAAPGLAQLGPYEIIKPLGAGSFGVVYLAEDRRLHRRVALKIARASVLTDPTRRTRLFREAEALARLEHPHIVPVYEADEIDGLCFLALGYCEGPTLDEWLGTGHGSVEPMAAVRLMLPLVEAVEHAHGRGILHRDIKPGNILLQRCTDLRPANSDLSSPTFDFIPKLTDFGLAKLMEDKRGETLAGTVLGTADYMAPEQAAGHTERIGPATDVYALGAVLFQLLSGHVPIEGNSTIDTLRRVLIDDPPELHRLVAEVPEDLGAIVRKCLQKSPSLRYASAAELGDDLKRFLDGRPTKARPLAAFERLTRSLRRHKSLAPLLALAATAMGLSCGLLWSAYRLSHTHSRARQAEEQLGEANQLAQSRDLVLAEQAYATDLFAAGQSTAKGDIAQAIEALRRQQPAAGHRDLRGLEWHYLWALNSHETPVLRDTGNQIYHICLSPDGKQLAAVGSRGLLRIYDAKKLELTEVISTEQVETNGVAYSPSGQWAATAGDDGTIRIFDLSTRQQLLRIPAHHDKAFGVVFFDGQNKLASCAKEPIIRLWDAVTGEPAGTLPGHTAQVEAIAFAPQGNLLASASADKTAVIWDLATRKVLRVLRGHRGPVMSVCFSPDGRWVATGAKDNMVTLWDVRTGRPLDNAKLLDELQSVAFSSDGSRLFAGDRNGSVHQYRVGPRTPQDRRVQLDPLAGDHAWHAHDKRIWCIAAGSQPGTFYTTGEDQLVRRWDDRPLGGAERTVPAPAANMFVDLDFSPDGKLLMALCESSGITVYDVRTLRPVCTLACRHSQWRSLKVLSARDEVAAGNAHGTVAIWNYKTGELKRLIVPASEDFSVLDLAYSPQADLLAVSAYDLDELRVYRAATGELVAQLPTTNHTAIAISPDGRHVAVDLLDSIALYDVQTQRAVRWPTEHAATITSLAFSPDGSLLASGSADRTVRLWAQDGKSLVTLTGHLADVNEVGFTPDGRTLISLDERGAAIMTSVAMRQTLFELPTRTDRLRALAISPDNRRLAAIRTLRNAQQIVVLGAPPGP